MAVRKPIAAVGSAVFFPVGPGVVVGLIPWLLTRWRVREPVRYWAPCVGSGRFCSSRD
jgi:hypothetical protein